VEAKRSITYGGKGEKVLFVDGFVDTRSTDPLP
jgi:hypoxanthine phosphoribosyltransferase